MKHASKIIIDVLLDVLLTSTSYDTGASDSMRHAGKGQQSPKNKTTKAPGSRDLKQDMAGGES